MRRIWGVFGDQECVLSKPQHDTMPREERICGARGEPARFHARSPPQQGHLNSEINLKIGEPRHGYFNSEINFKMRLVFVQPCRKAIYNRRRSALLASHGTATLTQK
eukprot:TRINITY_DN7103_c0_g1_i3.p1 TRINITY_DN7103_c0_g1~~TRINITY_DN7103_c0_g1_i3.p1  ORF type:complete len:107 (-),score=3.42 TRINITY_DN7103_c0_g1_i3:181-501(-)